MNYILSMLPEGVMIFNKKDSTLNFANAACVNLFIPHSKENSLA